MRSIVNSDDQVKAYIKKIMSQLNKWMLHGKISKFVLVISDKDDGERLERWQFNVEVMAGAKDGKKSAAAAAALVDKENVYVFLSAFWSKALFTHFSLLVLPCYYSCFSPNVSP